MGGNVQSIIDGKTFSTELINDINQATSSVMVTDFPWDNGSFSKQLFIALINAANRKVSVRVLLDGFGGRTVRSKWITELKNAGGEVKMYHSFDILNPLQYNVRDHERSFVIDGSTAFTGGVGIVDYWIENADGFPEWHDLMFEVHGNMAASLQKDFSDLWTAAGGQTLPNVAFYPVVNSKTETTPYISIGGAPSANLQPVRDTFILTALSAKKKLYIESPYIIPDQQFLTILEDKAQAGVDVRIISPGSITSGPLLRSAWHADYEALLEAGVRIYEYQPTMIHSKIMVADDIWSVIGSANLDNRSQSINAEDIMGVSDPVLAQNLDTIFANDMASSSEITLPAWQKEYGFFDRVVSEFGLIFWREL